MRFELTFVIGILLFSWLHAVGQDSAMWVGFETGGDFFACESLEDTYIRGDNPNLNGFARPTISSELYKAFAGVKIERQTLNERLGFSTGFRFTHLSSSIRKTETPEYFYFRLRQTGTTTEYLRVKQLREASNYIGIPLEASFLTRRGGRLYFTAGGEWSYQLTTTTDVGFHDKAMQTHASAVREIIGEPESWFASFYIGARFMFGKSEPPFSVAITIPMITHSVSRLNTPAGGGGFQIQYRVPLK